MDARSGQGFPPSCRLRTSREYTRVWRNGRRCHTAHLLVIACVGSSVGSRLGVSVSRKIGNAVCRNRLKRWIREYFRTSRAWIATTVELSVIVKPGAAGLNHAELDVELREALERLQVCADA